MSDTPLNPDARTECVDMLLEIMGYPRDELFEYPNRADDSIRYITRAERTLDKILAVAQPEVNTVEELDALPVQSVIEDAGGSVFEVAHNGERNSDGTFYREYLMTGYTHAYSVEEVDLPATVLKRAPETPRR